MIEDNKKSIEKELRHSLELAAEHYENFPVVSFLVPKRLKKHVALIYRFARQADDIADEGMLPDRERLAILFKYEEELSRALAGKSSDPFWSSLAKTINENNLTHIHFYNLLKAFRQDIVKKRYSSITELLNYCCNSANPVGRLILELYDIRQKNVFEYSDYICTALQLTNFYQDISVDLEKGRIYIPQDEMSRFDVTEEDFELRRINVKFKALLKFQVERAREMFSRGRGITRHLPFPLRNEIIWTILGGEAILKKIENIDYKVLDNRPKLNKIEHLSLIVKTFF